MSKVANYYQILNSKQNASYEELKENYRRLILKCHPDKLLVNQQIQRKKGQENLKDEDLQPQDAQSPKSETLKPSSDVSDIDHDLFMDLCTINGVNGGDEKNFILINQAWNTLKDPSKRKLYDAELLLTKFQTHSNIFAHITLADMQRCIEETDEIEETEEASDNKTQSTMNDSKEIKKQCTSILYTYNCRCGGQYIVDDSAQNEYFTSTIRDSSNDNTSSSTNSVTSTSTSTSTTSTTTSTSFICHKNVGNNDNNVEEKDNQENEARISFTETIPVTDVQEELLVECSECSLVIVLQPQQIK